MPVGSGHLHGCGVWPRRPPPGLYACACLGCIGQAVRVANAAAHTQPGPPFLHEPPSNSVKGWPEHLPPRARPSNPSAYRGGFERGSFAHLDHLQPCTRLQDFALHRSAVPHAWSSRQGAILLRTLRVETMENTACKEDGVSTALGACTRRRRGGQTWAPDISPKYHCLQLCPGTCFKGS